MANWANPTLTSLYTDFLTQLKDRDTDLALQFDGTTSTSIPTGTIRWNSTANRWQKWSGTAWGELTTTYALTGLSTTGNASIGGTLSVTGSTALGTATATTVATGDNSTNIATTAFVKAQAYATLASPALTGTPTAPTAAVGTNTTQLATTAYVNAEIANDAPTKTGTGASGTWAISITGNSATTSQRAFASDIASSGQGRFTGWYSDGAGNTGLGVEVGVSGGAGYVITYNRATATYGALNFQGGSTTAVLSGGTFNVTNGALQQAGNQVLHAGNYNNYAPTLTGTNASGTWGINVTGSAATATSATTAAASTLSIVQDTRAALIAPSSYADQRITYEFTNQIVGGFHSAITARGWVGASYATWQIIGPADTSATENFYLRSGLNTTWNPVRTILHSGNYNSYSPTLTGTGASGTWGINVTGSAASATSATSATTATNQSGGTVSATTGAFSGDVTMSGTGQLKLASGTTAQRSGTPTAGMIRYNTTLNQFEGYGTAWGSIGGGATGGGSDAVFLENGQTVTTDYTLSTGKNAVSAGPVTINSGITVTIPSGASWAIV